MIWNELDHKGRIATIIGIFFSLPYNIKFVIDFLIGIEIAQEVLYQMMAVNAISMVWFILPSSVIISGKGFSFEIKD